MHHYSIKTRFTDRFKVTHPFAAAGMAFTSATPRLAIAVSQAGGIGSLAVGLMQAEELRQGIRAIKAATDKPFNINFITCFENDAQIRVCIEEKVPIVSFHWGHPAQEHMKLLLDAGISVWEQVGSVEAARKAINNGVEVIIAQGWEAGGHNYGGAGSMVLIPSMVDAVGEQAIVLASGGIADGRGVAASLALGADAVWVGTRLIATPEANTHPEHKRRVLQASCEDTRLSAIFGPEWPHFNPMRLLRNRVVDEYTDRLDEVPMERGALETIGTTIFRGEPMIMRKFNVILPTPETEGDWEEMPWLAGQSVGLVKTEMPAAQVVAQMMSEAQAVLTRTTQRIALAKSTALPLS